MAIIFEATKKPFNWFRLVLVLFICVFIGFGAYYLFFAPSPKLDIVLPAQLERATQISGMQFVDNSAVLNSQKFRKLQNYVGSPSVGVLGRNNPFVKF